MKKRIISVLVLLLTVLLCLSGCTKKEEAAGYDLSGKTYYCTVDDYGNEEHSKIWFGKDGSFVMKDNFYDGYYEISGTWKVSENVVTLDVTDTGVGEFKKIIFEIEDEELHIEADGKGYFLFSDNKYELRWVYEDGKFTFEDSSDDVFTGTYKKGEISGKYFNDYNYVFKKKKGEK